MPEVSYIDQVKFSRDGKHILTYGDNLAQLWDVRSGALLINFQGHTKTITSATFSPDGKRVLTTSEDRTAKIWSVTNGALLSTLHHDYQVKGAAFTPDGKLILSEQGSFAKVWDVQTGAFLRDLKGISSIDSEGISTDSARIVAPSYREAGVWNINSGKQLLRFEADTDDILDARFSPNNRLIVTASRDQTAKIWSAKTAELIKILRGHKGHVYTAGFSPDGKRILTTSPHERMAKIWDVQTGALLHDLNGLSENVYSAHYSPDGKTVAGTPDFDKGMVWDAETGVPKYVIGATGISYLSSAAFSADSSRIATVNVDRVAQIWNAKSGRLIQEIKGHGDRVWTAPFSSDGGLYLSETEWGSAKVWDSKTGSFIREVRPLQEFYNSDEFFVGRRGGYTPKKAIRPIGVMRGELLKDYSQQEKDHENLMFRASLSPDGSLVLTTREKQNVKIWDSSTGALLQTLTVKSKSIVRSAFFSFNGDEVVTASDEGILTFWDPRTGMVLRELHGNLKSIISASFSPDGTMIVTRSSSDDEAYAELWDAKAGKLLRDLKGHKKSLYSALFSQDGRKVVTASEDGTAMVWDVKTGNVLLTLKEDSIEIRQADFTPDGNRIVTSGDDHKFRIWEARSGKLLQILTLLGGDDYFSISSDGMRLATTDGTIHFWDIATGAPLYQQIVFENGSWIVLAPDGRYDSSDGPTPRFGHFVIDTSEGTEAVSFNQLNVGQYYEPDLARKINEGIYKPGAHPVFDQLPYPRVQWHIEGDKLTLRVTERDSGGIGNVRILIGGMVAKTFRKGELRSGSLFKFENTDLDQSNISVDVVADNAAGTLSSPHTAIQRGSVSPKLTIHGKSPPLRFVGLIMGVKNYLVDLSPLGFSGEDAISITRAMVTLAKSLNVKPELYLLTDANVPSDLHTSGIQVLPPTKDAFNKVVKTLKATTFTSNTLLILDLSGHGTMVGDKYLYLTQDVRTGNANALANPTQFKLGISIDEIFTFLKLGIASKRLLILDTCQAGSVQNLLASNLKAGEDESDSQRKTVADWQNKNAVGTQVLLGCPSDAVSFEDPRYGHGLLTYSMLNVLREADLGDVQDPAEVLSDKFVLAAAQKTRQLAGELGLKQAAEHFGANSFPIGRMTRESREKAIDLPDPKPAIGNCTLTDEDDLPVRPFNNAFLKLLETSSRGEFVRAQSQLSPGVWELTGKYLIGKDGQVTLRLRLSREGEQPGKLEDIITKPDSAAKDAYEAIIKWFDTHKLPTAIR